ncbi:MAG: hypothetical protein KIS83_13805 [Rubrivivax sp.]|nr:hypothetical protein [Rubrivivax sp.]
MRETLRRLHRLAGRYSSQTAGTLGEIRLACAVADIQAAMAELDWDRVIRLALPLAQDLHSRGRLFLGARLRLQAAIGLAENGHEDDAQRLARGLLLPAAQCGMRRLFREDGESGLRLARMMAAGQDLRFEEWCLLEASLGSTSGGPLLEVSGRSDSALLSPRELEIVQMLGRALSVKTVARALNVSTGTVKWHLNNAYGKLGAVSREDAVAKARAMNILA